MGRIFIGRSSGENIMPEVAIGTTVKLSYEVKLEDGTVIDASAEDSPLEVHVGETQLIPGFIDNIKGMQPGDKKTFSVDSANAYGEVDPNLIRELPKSSFPEDMEVQVGDMLAATNDQGQEIPFVVVEIGDDTVKADFNHVLAGKNLVFDVEILDIKQPKS